MGALALLGIWHPVTRSVLPVPALLALTSCALLIAHRALCRAREPIGIEPDVNGTWIVTRPASSRIGGQQRFSGCTLTRGGFQSASLLVLSLRTADGQRIRIDVWRHKVSAPVFSALHLALLDGVSDAVVDAPPQAHRYAALHSSARTAADVDARRTEEEVHP